MPESAPPGVPAHAADRRPETLTPEAIEAVLADFRSWLHQTAATPPEPVPSNGDAEPVDRQAPDARAWSRLKGLVVHGYFTSERVQKDVLKTVVMPGRFDGNAPMKAAGGANG